MEPSSQSAESKRSSNGAPDPTWVYQAYSDLDRIAAVTGQACEWIVPAGSAD